MSYIETRKKILNKLEEIAKNMSLDEKYTYLIDVPDDYGWYTSLDLDDIIKLLKDKINKEEE